MPLRAALTKAGVHAETRAWDDPSVDWSTADLAVIRSTWNYVRHYDAFLAWVDGMGTRLWNPPSVVRWNSHKGYLQELGKRGLPVVPTVVLPRGSAVRLADVMTADEVVVKPAISAGSFGTSRVKRADVDRGESHLRSMLADRDMMVQPYFPSVETHGERSLIWIDGTFTHEMRKSARFAGDKQHVTGPFPVAPEERAVAEQILEAAPGPLLYARVDLARDAAGRPHLMELELIEPSLFLDERAADHLAAAIARRCG